MEALTFKAMMLQERTLEGSSLQLQTRGYMGVKAAFELSAR